MQLTLQHVSIKGISFVSFSEPVAVPEDSRQGTTETGAERPFSSFQAQVIAQIPGPLDIQFEHELLDQQNAPNKPLKKAFLKFLHHKTFIKYVIITSAIIKYI